MILYVVIGSELAMVVPAFKLEGNFGPFVSELIVASKKDFFFIACPLSIVDVGVQLVVPSE